MNFLIKCLMVALVPLLSVAHAEGGAYLNDTSGAVVKNTTGLCWRTGVWTPASANQECDGVEPAAVQPADSVKEALPPMSTEKMPINVVLSGFFEFDKSTLNQSEKDKLKEVAKRIGRFNVDTIGITGHTDRIGSEKYNSDLSLARAEAVKAELVALGVDGSKISTQGLGESEPVVSCNAKSTAKVISCLAPNRRVLIEVFGQSK